MAQTKPRKRQAAATKVLILYIRNNFIKGLDKAKNKAGSSNKGPHSIHKKTTL